MVSAAQRSINTWFQCDADDGRGLEAHLLEGLTGAHGRDGAGFEHAVTDAAQAEHVARRDRFDRLELAPHQQVQRYPLQMPARCKRLTRQTGTKEAVNSVNRNQSRAEQYRIVVACTNVAGSAGLYLGPKTCRFVLRAFFGSVLNVPQKMRANLSVAFTAENLPLQG